MADKSSIEWTDATWNPIAGCSIVSPGCTNCYAMRQADRVRQMTGPESHYSGTTKIVNGRPVWTGSIKTAPDSIFVKPLTWRRPRRIFVNSMSDLFHPKVPRQTVAAVFAIMALCPQHTFQILTKRPDRMCEYLSQDDRLLRDEWFRAVPAGQWPVSVNEAYAALHPDASDEMRALYHRPAIRWPICNIWLGTSVEDQRRANERIPVLLQTPAALHWISAEPLLGKLDLTKIHDIGRSVIINALEGTRWIWGRGFEAEPTKLGWVVVGLESGHGARPMHPDCVRILRDQCVAAGVPFLFKQWGSFSYHEIAEGGAVTPPIPVTAFRSRVRRWQGDRFVPLPGNASAREAFAPGVLAFPTTKKAAGRVLDGATWDQYPEVRI